MNVVQLETGHVIRLRTDHSQRGTVRFVNRVEGRLFINDPEYMASGDLVRVMWDDLGRRDNDVSPVDLEVQVGNGRRLVWVQAT